MIPISFSVENLVIKFAYHKEGTTILLCAKTGEELAKIIPLESDRSSETLEKLQKYG